MKATNDDVDLRYPSLEIALEGFEQCLKSWERKKKVTIVENKIGLKHINWECAKDGLSNKQLEEAYKDVLKRVRNTIFFKKGRLMRLYILLLLVALIMLPACQGVSHCIRLEGGSDKFGIDNGSVEYCFEWQKERGRKSCCSNVWRRRIPLSFTGSTLTTLTR